MHVTEPSKQLAWHYDEPGFFLTTNLTKQEGRDGPILLIWGTCLKTETLLIPMQSCFKIRLYSVKHELGPID